MPGINRRKGFASRQKRVTAEVFDELRARGFGRVKTDQFSRLFIEADEIRRRQRRRPHTAIEGFRQARERIIEMQSFKSRHKYKFE
jgi:hypothetical protein